MRSILTILSLFSFLLLTSNIQAQIGIHGAYGVEIIPGVDFQSNLTGENFEIPGSRLYFGVGYQFKPFNSRIEFFPTLNGAYKKVTFSNGFGYDNGTLELRGDVNVYLFDLEGDCQCPTFSKQGNFFTKGFFLTVSPNLVGLQSTIETENLKVVSRQLKFGFGFGAGLDLGLSDWITLTPYVRYDQVVNYSSDYFDNILQGNADISVMDQSDRIARVSSGIRLLITRPY